MNNTTTEHKKFTIYEHTTTFTTEPKKPSHRRGNQTIRRNCIEFVEAMKKLRYVRVTLKQAKQIFEGLFGPRDRTTLKAYFGTMPGTSTRIVDRTATYQTGTVSQKKIVLKQKVLRSEGYLERLGLVSFFEYAGKWYLELNEEGSVVPEIALSSMSSEGSKVSNADFSLTPIDFGGTPKDECEHSVSECEKRESSYRVRERKNIGKIGELSPRELAILRASKDPGGSQ